MIEIIILGRRKIKEKVVVAHIRYVIETSTYTHWKHIDYSRVGQVRSKGYDKVICLQNGLA